MEQRAALRHHHSTIGYCPRVAYREPAADTADGRGETTHHAACIVNLRKDAHLADRRALQDDVALLQPLGTHAFLPYKRALEDAYQGARELSRNGDPSIECFMPCIYAASRAVLENSSWCDAFNKNGFGLRQRGLRRFIFEQLGTRCCVAPLERPSAEQVTQCFPRGSHAPIEHLWRIFDRDIPLVHASAAPVASEPLGGIVPCELVSIGPPGVSTRSCIVNGSRFTLCRHRSNSIGDAFDDASAARAAAYPQTLPVRQHGSDRLCFCWLHAFMH